MKLQTFIACFIVLQKDDAVLMAKRAGNVFMNGHYNFPSGHLEEGESLVQVAIREAKEEIWVQIESADLELVHVLYRQSPDKPYIYFYRRARKRQWEPQNCEPDKCSELQRIPLSEIDKHQLTPGDAQAIREISKWVLVSNYRHE